MTSDIRFRLWGEMLEDGGVSDLEPGRPRFTPSLTTVEFSSGSEAVRLSCALYVTAAESTEGHLSMSSVAHRLCRSMGTESWTQLEWRARAGELSIEFRPWLDWRSPKSVGSWTADRRTAGRPVRLSESENASPRSSRRYRRSREHLEGSLITAVDRRRVRSLQGAASRRLE